MTGCRRYVFSIVLSMSKSNGLGRESEHFAPAPDRGGQPLKAGDESGGFPNRRTTTSGAAGLGELPMLTLHLLFSYISY